MQIRHMIDDYRILCKKAHSLGHYNAYKDYTEKYRYFFDSVFKYLYCCPMDDLKDHIERVDFNSLLEIAESNYANGMCDYIVSDAHKFINAMGIDFEFIFLLGLELSNIGGCATPVDTDIPYLYIGIDRPLTKEFSDIFLPHEMHHLIRSYRTNETASQTLFSRIVTEGTASYAPIWLHNLEWNADNVARVLSIDTPHAEYLIAHTDDLLKKVLQDGDSTLSPQVMDEYFCVKDTTDNPQLPGYYIGLYLTHMTVMNGVNFNELTVIPTEKILNMWFNPTDKIA